MWDRLLTLYRYTVDYLERLVADLDDNQLRREPALGVNSGFWLLGHLAICVDYGRELLGKPFACPETWHLAFGPGTSPYRVPEGICTKSQLLASIVQSLGEYEEALPTINEAKMAEPTPIEMLKPMFPTNGEVLAHLLSTHAALHVGQLSAWRRMCGFPPV